MENYEVEIVNGSIVIHFNRDLIASFVEIIKPRIKDVCNNSNSVILDFENVEMVDSLGIGFLVAINNTLLKHSGTLEVVNISADVLDLFKSMHLNHHFSLKGV